MADQAQVNRSAAELPLLPSRFVVHQSLGTGSFGTVWEVYDRERGHKVALKTLHQVDPVVLYRFKNEFRSFADIVHPNLVGLHEMFCFRDRWFFTMDLVEGDTFLRHVQRASADRHSLAPSTDQQAPPDSERNPQPELPFDEPRLRAALFGLTQGVLALHNAGKIHRDLKPSNVLVTNDGHVVLLDFGMIRELDDDDPQITIDRQVIGTPAYMSPEQAAGFELTQASDWYAVGVMLYEALTLKRPHQGNARTLFLKKQTTDAPDPRTLVPNLPEDLAFLASSLVLRDPNARPSGREVLRRLDEKSVIATSFKTEKKTRQFFGRAAELAFLHEHLQKVSATQAAIIRVHGPSGIGKSALISRFLEQVRAKNKETVILRTRCSEQESIPLKALDGLVDSLVRYLITLSPDTVKRLFPPDFPLLLRVFPVLARVPTFGTVTPILPASLSIEEVRTRAFDALKQMLSALSRRRLLLMHVDDLQWVDLESAKALRALVRPPYPMVVMLLESYRTGGLAPHDALKLLMSQPDSPDGLMVRDLAVGPLEQRDCTAFALSLMESDQPDALKFATVIAREALGNPSFVRDLVRQYLHDSEPEDRESVPPDIRLDQVIAVRIASLTPSEKRLLDVIAIAERPIPLGCLGRASDTTGSVHECLTKLRSQRLILTRGHREQDPVIVSHERVRQAVIASLSTQQQQAHCLALAHALEASPMPDAETLALCYRGAALPELTVKYASIAANRAFEALVPSCIEPLPCRNHLLLAPGKARAHGTTR